MALFENPVARRVGDILTIILKEKHERAEERGHDHQEEHHRDAARRRRCSARP